MSRRRLVLFAALLLVVVAGVLLWSPQASLKLIDQVPASALHIQDGQLLYITTSNRVKRYDLEQNQHENLGTINGIDGRFSPTGTYISYVRSERLVIKDISSFDTVTTLDGSVYAWQNPNTVIYLENDQQPSIFRETGMLTTYNLKTGRTQAIRTASATELYPLSPDHGIILEAVEEHGQARLLRYDLARNTIDQLVPTTHIDSNYSNGQILAFRADNHPGVQLVTGQGEIRSTGFNPVSPVYTPISHHQIIGSVIEGGDIYLGVYNTQSKRVDVLFPLQNIGGLIGIATSTSHAAVSTQSGVYIGGIK